LRDNNDFADIRLVTILQVGKPAKREQQRRGGGIDA